MTLSTLERPAVAGAAATAPSRARSASGEYLAFRIGDEEYGIDILRVQEIRGYEAPTRIADAPACVRGVLNLRGVIVPVADLRLHLGAEARFDEITVTVVLNVGGQTVGAVVDSVSDVIQLAPAQVRPPPEFDRRAGGCITGLGCIGSGADERMLILIDIEALMGERGLGLACGASS